MILHAGPRGQVDVAEQFTVPGDRHLRRRFVRDRHGTTGQHQLERSGPGEPPGDLRPRSLVRGEGALRVLPGRRPAGHQFPSLVVVARDDLARLGCEVGKIQVGGEIGDDRRRVAASAGEERQGDRAEGAAGLA
ncbi:MAG: hypothetical protein F4230_06785 [Holophagales bacterium]|nr:hypothetical protein [Holophagales bacterium]